MPLTDVFKPIRRRTQQAYLRLFKNPAYLFGRGTRTIVFPNGARELWIKNANGTACFRVTASDGPAGFMIRVHSAASAADAHVLRALDYQTEITRNAREIEMVAYYPDEYSQGFRRWYECDARDNEGKKTVPHPSELGLKPREMTPEDIGE